jgi:hypothetical protein
MTELLHTVTSWPSLLLVVLVFGFAPGFCLRLIVLAYPRSDPRRTELIAELYTVPRIQRPLWVAEQLETALFEGLPHRLAAILQSATLPHRTPAKAKFIAGLVWGLGIGLGVGFGAGLWFGVGASLGAGLIAGLGVGLGAWLKVESRAALWFGLGVALWFGLGAGLRAGLVTGLWFGLVTGLWFGCWFIENRRKRAHKPSPQR